MTRGSIVPLDGDDGGGRAPPDVGLLPDAEADAAAAVDTDSCRCTEITRKTVRIVLDGESRGG